MKNKTGNQIKPGTPIIFEWEDIVSWSGWNTELIENGEDEPWLFRSIGFVLRDTDRKLTVSDTYPDIGAVAVFPKGCLKTIKVLTEA